MFNLQQYRISTTYYLGMLLIPVLIAYTVIAFREQHQFISVGIAVAIGMLSVMIWQVKKKENAVLMTNATAAYCTLLLVVIIFTLPSSALWALIMPPIALLCLGTRSGLIISLIYIPVLVISLMLPESVSQSKGSEIIKPFLLVVYIIIMITSAIFSRILELGELATEKNISHIQKLESMLSMCMHCSKIEMESEWHKLEDYVSRHTQVSHGLCPLCAEEHYGDLLSET